MKEKDIFRIIQTNLQLIALNVLMMKTRKSLVIYAQNTIDVKKRLQVTKIKQLVKKSKKRRLSLTV